MAVHVVYTRPQQVLNGIVIDKKDATIAEISKSNMEIRVMEDSDISTSTNNPTIKNYLETEDANGFNLIHMDNNIIVTSNV